MRLRRQPDVILGFVTVVGTAINGTQGSGFTVSRVSAGNYQINLPPGYRLISVMADATVSIPGVGHVLASPGRFAMWVTNTGGALDASFSFVAAKIN